MQDALVAVPVASLTDLAVLGARLLVREMLGPASLAYLDAGEFRPQGGQDTAEAIPPRDLALRRFLAAGDPMEVEESGLGEITSPAFAVREHGRIAAIAGYRDWPGQVAHLSVLTAAPTRGVGWPGSPRRPLLRTRCTGASCHSGGSAHRRPGASPVPSAPGNSAPRPASACNRDHGAD